MYNLTNTTEENWPFDYSEMWIASVCLQQILLNTWHVILETCLYRHWGPGHPPAERGPSLENIYRVSLTADLCKGNKIITLKKIFTTASWGPLKKKTIPGALGTCPVCPLVKMALFTGNLPAVKLITRLKITQRYFKQTNSSITLTLSASENFWSRAI